MLDRQLRLHVAICTHNRADSLGRALEALERQRVSSRVRWGVLVVENCCTDETPSVVERYRRRGRFPLDLVSEPTLGLTPARQRAVAETSSEWIAFIDDDCLLAEDWIEEAADFARAHPGCGAFGGLVEVGWEAPAPDYIDEFGWAYAAQDHGDAARRVSCLVGAGLVVRRRSLEATGWTREPLLQDRIGRKLISGGDVEIALRLGAESELWYTPRCRLRHVIAAHRTRPAYVRSVTFGLGTSKLLGDTMLWRGSYPAWVLASIREALVAAGRLLRVAGAALRGRRAPAALLLDASFEAGRWVGIVRLATASRRTRRKLLGCAKPGSSVLEPEQSAQAG